MLRFARIVLLSVFFAVTAHLMAQNATPISGQAVPSLAQLDTIMQQYMTQYSSPGANLSVSVDGRLVFARGYGYANTTTGEFVQPDSRMRLASNSKIITTVGILKLIEQGKLSLTTQPFVTIMPDLKPPTGTTEDPRILQITVSELLLHTAGYDDGTGYPHDPVNDYPTNRAAAANAGLTGQQCTPAALISYMLGVPLQHDPGTTYAYSNLGYLTLGYIIERVTGTPYATWIEQNIFPTALMTQTLPANNLASQKLPYEVAYYGQEGSAPSMVPPVGVTVPFEYGGLDLQLELANGGWTSTPMDLLRLWDTLNGQYSYNILSSPQTARVGDIPPVGQNYLYTFYGSLPATNSLVHLNTTSQVVGRVVYSAIFNTRSPIGGTLEEPELDADTAIQNFVQTVKAWPTGDLFPTYATAGTACTFTLPTATATATAAGGGGTVSLTDANSCAWAPVSNASWIHITATGFYNATASPAYTVDANTGVARNGTITLGGQTFTITQGGTTTPTTLTLKGTGTLSGTTESVTLTATLAPYTLSGNSTDGETITFLNGSTTLGTGKLASGVATLTVTVPNPGTNAFTASYTADTYFSSSTSSALAITPTSTMATVSPATLTFPSTPTGLTSAAMTSTFTNTGTTALTINTITVTGPFKQTSTCGTSVVAGGTCVLSITYAPTVTGPSTGSVDVNDQAGDQIVSLTGTAVASAPIVSFSSSTLTFPSTIVGNSSATQTVTITNTGNAALTISTITGSSQFTQNNTCSASVAVNATCTVTVTFSPTASGPQTGTITLTDNATPATQTIALTGTAVAALPVVSLSASSLTFASTTVNSSSAAQTVTVTNTGNTPLTVTSVGSSAYQFAQTNTCSTVAVNATCTISVIFTPTSTTTLTATLTLTDNASPASQTVALSGTGVAGPTPAVTLTPASLTFAGTQVSSTSAAQTAVLTNSGTAALTITGITATAGFAQTNNCPASLAANATCTISVTSTPTAVGPYTGAINLADNASGSPQALTLAGTGAAFSAPTIVATGSVASLSYGAPVTISATSTGVQAAGSYTWSLLDGAAVVTSGVANTASFSYTVATPTAGAHNYTAVLTSTNATTYPTGTSNIVGVTVAKASTTSSFPTPAAITYGTALSATQLAATSATPGTFVYTPAAGTILGVGTQTLSATLTPTDAVDYAASTATTTIVVNKGALTVTAASASRAYGAANPTFTGTVAGAVSADGISATYSSVATATTAAGTTSPITATVVDPNSKIGNYTVTLVPATLTITQAGSTATLTGPTGVTPAGTAIMLTATIASATTGTPTGMVTLSSGSTNLGTATLAGGVATLSYTPPTGTTSLTLSYGGDTNFTASTGSLSITTGIPDFSLGAAPSSATVTAGTTAVYTVTNAGTNGFSQTLYYSCSGLPFGATCVFAPAVVAPGQSTKLSIVTVAPRGLARNRETIFGDTTAKGLGGAVLACLFCIPLIRRRSRTLQRGLFCLLLLAGLTMSVVGCANGPLVTDLGATPTGTYNVTVSATAGTTTHTTVLTLTVQ